MDDKLTPSNMAGAADRAPGTKPEDLQAGSVGAEAAPVETAPAPGSSPSPQLPPVQAKPAANLSDDDVAAAIAPTPRVPATANRVPTPSAAGDVDVIEPEWVSKAEHEITQHQGDPYGEEEAIEDLQQDYLKQRYGYNVANPNNADGNKPEGT
jgi:hypothetical protein